MFHVSVLSALLVNVVLGLLVFQMNPRRRSNRYFLVGSAAFSLYTACLAFGAFAAEKASIIFWIQQASAASLLLPAALDVFRLAMTHEEKRAPLVSRELAPWALLFIPVAVICQTPFFIRDIEVTATGFGKPLYGWGQFVYVAYWIAALFLLGLRYKRDLARARGIHRAELEFTVLGFVFSAVFGLGVAQVIPLLTGNRDITQLLPLAVVVLNATVAYGIVTRRIMNVNDVLRRATAYGLLVVYLVVLYTAVNLCGRLLLRGSFERAEDVVHVLAALAVAFSLAPAHGTMQRVANRLFISMQPMDVRSTIRNASETLMSIGTTDELMQRFAEIVMRTTGTDRLLLFLREGEGFTRRFAVSDANAGEPIPAGDSLVSMLEHDTHPVTVDLLRRARATQTRASARTLMEGLGSSIAVGIRAQGKLEGIVFLGPRLSGRVYGAVEQQALQLICNQFSVALENARLYTEAENSRIYNDILLDSLASGIVAANAARRVTVFNKEAQRITGLAADSVIGQSIEALPDPIVKAIDTTLDDGAGLIGKELAITRWSREETPIRLSSSTFHGHTGERMGALLVFTDVTDLKRLEAQVRRTDRLGSLGTLSAGMAHEIKNPLVSIKTFTQLLPERYDDPEFRETFFSLIGDEVMRIDNLVSRLLHFARPAQASIGQVHVHEV
ncbi:MAG: PAS domain-containing protein, partial [Lentisphaerae bacterium]|nr:PAS domain-containing protein [Lentisphaerota bacterium]